jgi:phosphoglycolate phosphatase-like HAD superfamily hydrolase
LRRAGIATGLVTGNLSRIAWKKMEQAGLRNYFAFGAFAEMADTRAELVMAAKCEALRKRWIDSATRITLIGDHPNDVLAAKLNSIQSIAVATGVIGVERLAASGPDVLLPDLRSLRVGMLL